MNILKVSVLVVFIIFTSSFLSGLWAAYLYENAFAERSGIFPYGTCEQELQMERHFHGEYYREWEECQGEMSRLVKQSIDAVCLQEYDEWQQLLDECWDDKRTHYTNLDICESQLAQYEWREDHALTQCRCRAWLFAGDEVHVEVIPPWETCKRYYESEDKCTFDSTWVSREQWLERYQ